MSEQAEPDNNLLIDALCRPQAYPHPVASIELIETHISWVLLTGDFAYKIKKPVNFGFLDFSTLEKRRFFCQEEIRLNQRLAQDWYLAVAPITGSPETPRVDGTGPAFDYAVKMRQFPSHLTLKDLAAKRQIDTDLINQISALVARFHETVERAGTGLPYGDNNNIKHWFDENFAHIRPLLDSPEPLTQLSAIEAWGHAEWASKAEVMRQRKLHGFIRECHGDLHLGNMSLIDGKVVLFDCIEFNPMLRWIDVMSEVAFLAMDLLHWGFSALANRFVNLYLQATGDYAGMALFRYYLVYRAMVRAKVAMLRKTQHPDAATCSISNVEYAAFVNLAESMIKNAKPMLIITHGYSGSGKSTYAGQLAEKIGALQIRSDIERKRLFGFSGEDNTHSKVNNGIYTDDASRKVYDHLAKLAEIVLNAGFSAIIDATFLQHWQRELFEKLARKSDVKFNIIDFTASEATLYERVTQRKNDASEATVEVLKRQLKSAEAFTKTEKNYLLRVNTEENDCLTRLLTFFDCQD